MPANWVPSCVIPMNEQTGLGLNTKTKQMGQWSGLPLLSLLCSTAAASSNLSFANQDTSGIGFRDDDFVIDGVVPSQNDDAANNNKSHNHHPLVHSAISILREVVGGPPTVLAVGSIVLIHHVARRFMMIPNPKHDKTTTASKGTTSSIIDGEPHEVHETLEIRPATIQTEDHYPNDTENVISETVLIPDYESLFKDLSEHVAQEQRRWERLQAELSEQKAYWEARANTQGYQHELAVQKLRAAMLGMLEEEKTKLQKSFQEQAEELRMRLGGPKE